MPLTEDDLKALREIAERARRVTAPEWSANLYKYPLGDTGDYDHCAVVLAQFGDIMTPRPFANVEDLGHDADAQKYLTEYIAKFDPATIDSLLDEIERLREECVMLAGIVAGLGDVVEGRTVPLEEVRKRLKEKQDVR